MIISNFGIAGCFKFGLAVGGGIRWSDGKGQAFAGLTCDIGQYRRRMPAGGPSRAGADTDETPVTLVGRDRVVKVVAAPGEDEAPHVVLEGDDGESIRSPHPDDEDGLVTREDGRAISDDDRTTLFILPPGSEGTGTSANSRVRVRWPTCMSHGRPEIPRSTPGHREPATCAPDPDVERHRPSSPDPAVHRAPAQRQGGRDP